MNTVDCVSTLYQPLCFAEMKISLEELTFYDTKKNIYTLQKI